MANTTTGRVWPSFSSTSAISVPSGANAASGPGPAPVPPGSRPPCASRCCLVAGELPRRERVGGGLGQRDQRQLRLELVQGPCHGEVVGAGPGAPEHGHMAAHPERVAQVAGQGTDVGAAGAGHRDVDIQQVTGAPLGQHAERPDGHRPGCQDRRGAGPGQPVGPRPADLDGADRGRDLLDLAGQRHRGGAHLVQGHRTGRGAGDDLALGVAGVGRLAEPDGRQVLLLGERQVPEQPGGLPDPGDQHARGHGIEGAAVADPAGPGEAPEPGHHVVRGHPAGLVHDDQPVSRAHRPGPAPAPAPSSSSPSSSSSSASAGTR